MHSTRARWKRKPTQKSLLTISLIIFILLFVLLYLFQLSSPTLRYSKRSLPSQFPQCKNSEALGQRFLWYAPHSGFSNQLSEFKNAILMAGILNRTLIIPPVLDHHAVALGSCPKFRVLSPNELRFRVWDHVVELIRTGRYVSMADILDLSQVLSSSMIRAIDLRDFVSIWCAIDLNLICMNDSAKQSLLLDNVRQCGSFLSGFEGNIDKCMYAIHEDCRTTVWTYQQIDDGALDSFQPDEQLRVKRKISYFRRRQDVLKTLGPGSQAHFASVLGFGSLFTAPYKGSELYIDIHKAKGDHEIQSLMEKVEFLPFAFDIIHAGKEFAHKIIKAPFLCAQLRLLDGQFKNHQKGTFAGLKQKAESLKQKGPLPVNVFVMTDLPEVNWTGTYLGELASDTSSFKLHILRQEDDLNLRTAEKVAASHHGPRLEYAGNSAAQTSMKQHCPRQLPDILLYIEESICSCASLGFIGTAGSTIAESIELMRKNSICSKASR